MTIQDNIISQLKQTDGQTDRELADVLYGKDSPQQSVNIACRYLKDKGIIDRVVIQGKIRNKLVDKNYVSTVEIKQENPLENPGTHLSEDLLKGYLKTWLESDGWETRIAWGHERGIDILATKENQRWVIEVKGEGSLQPMRVNYFLMILGETLQRMDDPDTLYSIALPDNKQFRNLWDRLPLLAKQRTGISIIFIERNGNITFLR